MSPSENPSKKYADPASRAVFRSKSVWFTKPFSTVEHPVLCGTSIAMDDGRSRIPSGCLPVVETQETAELFPAIDLSNATRYLAGHDQLPLQPCSPNLGVAGWAR